jgi:hypothetical protein
MRGMALAEIEVEEAGEGEMVATKVLISGVNNWDCQQCQHRLSSGHNIPKCDQIGENRQLWSSEIVSVTSWRRTLEKVPCIPQVTSKFK